MEFRSHSVDVYLGIPFAKPPLGELKFQKPKPIDRWAQPLYASKQPPACPQYSKADVPWKDMEPGQSEDCLYLNIWVPQGFLSGQRTVMYWIYGGGYYTGSNRLPVHNGEALATIGDVIVVTVNYRLGALGFLYSESDDAPGNMGLYDVLEGLKWVHSNIEAFGGNKNSITIFGESVGASTAGLFTISPLTRGLYKRVIMESFAISYIFDRANADNLVTSQNLSKREKCANDTFTIKNQPKEVVECMRRKSGYELAHDIYDIETGNPRFFIAQHSDELLPGSTMEAIRNSRFHQSELLIGVNSDEGAIIYPELFSIYNDKKPMINKTQAESLIRTVPFFPDPELVIDYYLNDLGEYDYDKIRERLSSAVGDIEINCGSFLFVEKFTQKGNVYFYYFTHRPSDSEEEPWVGATHFDEVKFVFGRPFIYPGMYPQSERLLSESIIKRWTTFAKHGYPDEDWPLYSERAPVYKILNTTFPSGVGESSERTKKFCHMYKKIFGF